MADRRSKFVSLEVTKPGVGLVGARVVLEWNRQQVTGEAEGEWNRANELRVSASAALKALEKIVEKKLDLVLVGVKELLVFDHNLVVVLVTSPQFPDRPLIGTSIDTGDRVRSAALAALNATNRVVGKFVDS
jgi:hypothetical protein